MQGIDFIGDIHGRADLLRSALAQLGFTESGSTFRHQRRIAVFLGDILNRGPASRNVVEIIRPMVDAGNAICLPGNHEAYAVWDGLAKKHPSLIPPLPIKAARHLAATKTSFRGKQSQWEELLNWLWNLPLYLTTSRVRAIHACWEPESLRQLRKNRLSERCFHPSKPEYHALWRILEGPSIRDPQTNEKFRVRWWERQARTWAGFAFSGRANLPNSPLPQQRLNLASPYPAEAPPCFFGHYGFKKPVSPLRPNLACLDFAVAQGGPIGIYRWNGEQNLLQQNFLVAGRK